MSSPKNRFFSWRQAMVAATLEPTTKHVLLTLAIHMNDLGESCYPSVALLVKETGLSKSAVLCHLKKALDAGWIQRDVHGFSGQGWRRNEYRAVWPDDILQGGSPDVPPFDEGGIPGDINVVQDVDLSTSKSTPISTVQGSSPKTQKQNNGNWDYKTFAIRCYRATGRHPGRTKSFREQYAKLVGEWGEEDTLKALDEWVNSRGGKQRVRDNAFAVKDFLFTEGPEILEAMREDAEKPEIGAGIRELNPDEDD